MLSSSSLLVTFSLLFQNILAQGVTSGEVVFGTVVFSRTGERTPLINGSSDATTLTNTGAMQSWNSAQLLRQRYLGILYGWSSVVVNSLQIYALASDVGDYTVQSGQAFLSGLYPPSGVTTDNGTQLDPDNVLWDGIYMLGPDNGAQFVRIHTAGQSDQESIFLDGETWCPAWLSWNEQYEEAAINSQAESSDQPLYTSIANEVAFSEVGANQFALWNAYNIYDYLLYEYNYNATVHEALSSPPLSNISAFSQAKYIADGFNLGLYTNTSSPNSISTIAGQGLATAVLSQLQGNIQTLGELFKISVFFGDFQPLVSFFGLADLQATSSDFSGLPQFGSYATFELFAPNNTSLSPVTSSITGETLYYPDPATLMVRFLFANGTNGQLTEYPLFGSSGSMSWSDFSEAMTIISFDQYADWCSACNAWDYAPFCLAYNATAWKGLNEELNGSGSDLAAPVAGIIGALVTLVVLGLVMLLAYFVGGVGLARRRAPLWARNNNQNGGGFKRDKMASDADLTLTKGSMGVSAVEKERVGSWELAPKVPTQTGGNMDGIESTQEPAFTGASINRPVSPYLPAHDENQGVLPFGHERASSAISSVRSSFDGHSIHHNPAQEPVQVREGI